MSTPGVLSSLAFGSDLQVGVLDGRELSIMSLLKVQFETHYILCKTSHSTCRVIALQV